ncbi:hypothetical protein DFH29DRAFT_949259 [Suillus ampliporus]|nr:hypothetical protein DFH29DRAFT_949259 [Suillus ampliporus]
MQASTIATTASSTTLSGSPGATTNSPAPSSSSSPPIQATSSLDVSTISSAITSSQPESTTSTSDIPSTSPETSSSTLTSRSSTSTSQSSTSTAPSTSSPSPSSSTSPPSPVPPNSPTPNSPTATSTTPTPTYGGQTTSYITSSVVTVINSTPTTFETVIPTVIGIAPTTNSGTNHYNAIVAGSVIGGGLLLILGLSVFFYRQRRRFKHFHFLDAINLRRRQASARETLLSGEDLDDVALARPPPERYSDYDTPWDPHSNTGSLNDNERGQLIDPLLRGADIDLSHIINDVMGPSSSGVQYSQNSISSSHRDLPGHDESEPQTRELSNVSQIALLEAAGLAGGSAVQPARPSPLGKNDPVVTEGGNNPR